MTEPTTTRRRPVWGAKNIAVVIDRTERQTYHMLVAGYLPAKKVGGHWVGEENQLLDAVVGEGVET